MIQDVADYGIGMQNLPTVIKETDSAILVSVSVPGIEKEALDIQYEEGYLTVGIDSVDVDKDSDSVTHLSEFSLGKQKRTYYIPDVNVDSMDASLKNGVLTVTLAKLDSVKPVSISNLPVGFIKYLVFALSQLEGRMGLTISSITPSFKSS